MSKIKILITDNIPLTPHLQGGPVRIFKNFNYIDKFNLFYIGSYGNYSKYTSHKIKEENIQLTKNKLFQHILYNYIVQQNNKLLNGGSFYDTINRVILLNHKIYNKKISKAAKACKILIASHPWTFSSLKKHSNKKHILVYDAHNCEYQLVKDKYKGILGKIITLWTKKIEKEACNKSHIILACSKNEKTNFIKYYKTNPKKIHIIPNSVETWKFIPSATKEKSKIKKKYNFKNKKCILFIATNYFPNNEAATYIVKKIAPIFPEHIFLFIGSVNVHFEKNKIHVPQNVKLFGQVSENKMQELVKACDLALNPITLGSGTNIKLLDYMSWGIPCITTARGVRGMKVTNKKEVIITPRNKFIPEIKKLLDNKDLYETIVKNGRSFVKENYDSKQIARNIENIIINHLRKTSNDKVDGEE